MRIDWEREKILQELEETKETQFDPKIAEQMIQIIKAGEVECGEEAGT